MDHLVIQINLLFLIGTFAVLLTNAVACGRRNIREGLNYKLHSAFSMYLDPIRVKYTLLTTIVSIIIQFYVLRVHSLRYKVQNRQMTTRNWPN